MTFNFLLFGLAMLRYVILVLFIDGIKKKIRAAIMVVVASIVTPKKKIEGILL